MTLRVSDEEYLGHVDRWWSVLLPRLSRFLYSRGGPIVLTQASGHTPCEEYNAHLSKSTPLLSPR